MGNRIYYVYIMTNKTHSTLYIGVTSDLEHRAKEHKNKTNPGFTAKYNINQLVHYEEFEYIEDAINREKQLKAGSRKRKVELITRNNPNWKDLSKEWV